MEHGSYQNPSASTFSVTDEDHTLANSLRLVLNKDPRVSFCGYSIPHPSEARVNVRVQTTAGEVLKDGCQNLINMCQHVRKTFDDAVDKFKSTKASETESMDDDSP
ncbi:uncharacterized protein [Spinacia oleracea]|uniref:DNA-directed RNA polymerases I and III subunit RPAC2 n=1 Tax=Spinacia oleracea TaxID=3562 RepID=A0A9R0K8D9_SPIOL|nr:uncharacterized protein LOC110800214 isoform X2 [Spinacia oleracea]